MSIFGFLLIISNNLFAADCPSAIAEIDGDALPIAIEPVKIANTTLMTCPPVYPLLMINLAPYQKARE
uniref:ABCB4 n=1 Tax=Arundo donax TaxID=35708 RepID=A0A0A9FRG5_ARUDO